MKSLVYLDHHFVSPKEATISVFDLSLSRGYGVSDYLRTYGRRPFHLNDHLKRLQASAQEVGLSLHKTRDEIAQIIDEGIENIPFEEVGIKLILTGGLSNDGYTPSSLPRFIVIFSPFIPYAKSYYEQGIALEITHSCRHFPTAKTIDYLPALIALQRSKLKKVIDVLFIDHQGSILEAGFANFFAFKNKTLITPGSHILHGITRKVVLELAKNDFATEIREVKEGEIPSFDSAFITSSNKEIMPVVRIGNHKIGDGLVCPSTRYLMRAFASYVSKESSPLCIDSI